MTLQKPYEPAIFFLVFLCALLDIMISIQQKLSHDLFLKEIFSFFFIISLVNCKSFHSHFSNISLYCKYVDAIVPQVG